MSSVNNKTEKRELTEEYKMFMLIQTKKACDTKIDVLRPILEERHYGIDGSIVYVNAKETLALKVGSSVNLAVDTDGLKELAEKNPELKAKLIQHAINEYFGKINVGDFKALMAIMPELKPYIGLKNVRPKMSVVNNTGGLPASQRYKGVVE